LDLEVLLFFFQAEDGIRDFHVTGVQTCALPAPSRGDLRTRLAALRDRRTLLLLGAGLVTLAVLWLPLGLLVDPQMPSPKVDPMYHYNVLNAVGETGNISLNSAVDFNYGLRVGHVMYPTVWHALAA